MATVLQDLRYGLRLMLRRPGTTTMAVLALALGIGANATILSAINAVFLRPLPVHDPERLVTVARLNEGRLDASLSYPDFADLRDHAKSLSGVAAYASFGAGLLTAGTAELVAGEAVSWNYFDVLGLEPALGRAFLPEEDRGPGSPPVAMLGHRLWRSRFGADPSILGRSVDLGGESFVVVGVAPRGFRSALLGRGADVWTTLSQLPLLRAGHVRERERRGQPPLARDRGSSWLRVVGRLAPGHDLAAARTELGLLAATVLPDAHPGAAAGRLELAAVPLGDEPGVRSAAGPVTTLLLGVTGLVLLIACANVANLLLSQALGRRRELAVRQALGAGRWRLIRQGLTESAALAGLGGAAGLLVATWGQELWYGFGMPEAIDLRVDLRLLGLTALAASVAALLCGALPAFSASRTPALRFLGNWGAAGDGDRGTSRLRGVLVVVQLATSLVLLVGSGLLVRTLAEVRGTDPGFRVDDVALVSFDLDRPGYEPALGRARADELLARVRAVRGVDRAALGSNVPLSGSWERIGVIAGDAPSEARPLPVESFVVGAGWFDLLDIPLVTGRDFAAADVAQGPAVAIVNEALVRRLWPDGNPLGRTLEWGGLDRPMTVVGVVADSKVRDLREEPRPVLYRPLAQHDETRLTLLVRGAGPSGAPLDEVREALLAVDRQLPLAGTTTLAALMRESLATDGLVATLVGTFGVTALLLSTIGLYAVVAFGIGQRTREIGVRMALGARSRDVLRLLLRQGAWLIAAGLAVGIPLAAAGTRLVASRLHGVSVADLPTWVGTALVLVLAAAAAVVIPAWRATRRDPLAVLRLD